VAEILDGGRSGCWPKTSGSKGLQLYVPLTGRPTWEKIRDRARGIAVQLERERPELVVSNMRKSLRSGKVLIDWSQNHPAKTTVAAYSLRAREEPTVSTPVSWDEVDGCATSGDPTDLRFTSDLVLERIEGEKVTEAHGLTEERAAELARTFFRAYIRQITVKGLYHADPHRGNVLITPDGRLALLDFGLIGRLDDDTRTSLALLLLAIAQNRADDVADLIVSLSLTSFASDEAGFVHDLRRTLPRYQWRSLAGIKAGEGLADLQRLCLQHGIALPTSFALVGKTLSQAESIARTLDPSLDPVELIQSEGRNVMVQEVERRLEPNQLLAYGFTQLQPLLRLPRRLSQLVSKAETGSLKIGIAPVELDALERLLRSSANRIGAAMIVSALLIASALMARVDHTFAVVGFSCAAVLGIYMLWRIARTPGGL